MTGSSLPKPALRPFLAADAPVLAEIFVASIEGLTGEDYNAAQQAAWAAQADDEQAFGARLARDLTLVATVAGSPVGFASLKGAERIEMLYVHPAAAGQGIGALLYDALEKLAAAREAARLVVDASDTAEEFFRRRGFQPQRRNSVPLGDEWLATTTLEKRLAPTRNGRQPS
jgi:putative acetyltransferase